VLTPRDEPRRLEDLEVPGDGRKTDRERSSKLRHSRLAPGESLNYVASRSVSERPEDQIQLWGSSHRHDI